MPRTALSSIRSLPRLLRSLLEERELVQLMRELPPATLSHIVRKVGIEDSGELLGLCSVEQLEALFDDALWVSVGRGQEESFVPERFALYLEVLLESGEQWVAERLLSLPEEFVTLGIAQLVTVIDIEQLAVEVSQLGEDAAPLEKALESCLFEELDEFRIIARGHEGWDSTLSVLLALDQRDPGYVRRLLERCAALSEKRIADGGGLYRVLSSSETLEVDARADREERRAARGYVSHASAISLLDLAARTPLAELMAQGERDPVTRAYFRDLAQRPSPPHGAAGRGAHQQRTALRSRSVSLAGEGRPEPLAATPQARMRFRRLLEEAQVLTASESPGTPASLLPHAQRTAPEAFEAFEASKTPEEPAARFQRAMARLRQEAPERYAERVEELAYVTNVLVAGHQPDGEQLRPLEAAEAALALCHLGLELVLASAVARPSPAATANPAGGAVGAAFRLISETPLERLFLVGWRSLAEA